MPNQLFKNRNMTNLSEDNSHGSLVPKGVVMVCVRIDKVLLSRLNLTNAFNVFSKTASLSFFWIFQHFLIQQ